MKKVICFDLEGPLSPQDNAYEVMGLLPDGHKIFEVISRYDDLLFLEGREEYEPGDTLSLIVPFLIYHRIGEREVKQVSNKAYIVRGAVELITELLNSGWDVYIISTSYEQHALNIANRLGLSPERVYCTHFPLNRLKQQVNKKDLDLLGEIEQEIIDTLYSENLGTGIKDKRIMEYLDWFFWEGLPKTSVGIPNKTIEVIGGRRKVWAIEKIARRHNISLRNIVFIGDSITDAQAVRALEASGGLSIAFNGNAFVIPYATVGLASTSLKDVSYILKAWERGGRSAVKIEIEKIGQPQTEIGPYYSWLISKSKRNLQKTFAIHKKIRLIVRSEAAKLG